MSSIVQVGTSYRAAVARTGHKRQTKTFKTPELAQEWADSVEAELDKLKPPEAHTVSQLITEFRNLRSKGERPILHGSNQNTQLKFLDEGLGPMAADKLTVQVLTNHINWRRGQGAGPFVAHDELGMLKRVLANTNALLGTAYPDTVSPTQLLGMNSGVLKPASGTRDRRPTTEELKTVIDKAEQPLKDIIRIAAILGLRREEIVKLKWAELDEQAKMLWVRDRKHPRMRTGNDNHIPLVGNSLEIIQRQSRTTPFIFTGISKEGISDRFLDICIANNIEDLHFHDMRHEAISRLFESGMQIQEVALISGHKSWAHLRRYTNLKPASMHSKTLDGLVTF